jgi:hypothetical protein
MRYLFGFMCVLALGVMPMVGCGETEGAGGSGGDGGNGGVGGDGGSAGVGGGGAGGSEPAPVGLWTGSGQGGADGSFTICFNVREDGLALVPSLDVNAGCEGGHSFAIEFDDCNGGLSTGEEVPIVDGVFHLFRDGADAMEGYWDITGTFDGDAASGDATVGWIDRCSGSWDATPSQ